MAGDITLKIDADTAAYIGKLQQMGEETKKHAQHVKSIGGLWEHANEHMGKSIIKGAAIAEVIAKATEELNKFADKAKELSKGEGSEVLERGRAFGTLGADEGARALVESGQGGASNQERTAGLTALASLKNEGRIPIDRKTTIRYLALINTGLFQPDELVERIKRGQGMPGDDEVASRLRDIGEHGRAELAVRSAEFQSEGRQRDATREAGLRNRAFQANRDALVLEHPVLGGVQGLIGDIPIIGNAANAADREVNSRSGNATVSGQGPVVAELQRQTAIMAGNQKHLNLTGQSEGAR